MLEFCNIMCCFGWFDGDGINIICIIIIQNNCIFVAAAGCDRISSCKIHAHQIFQLMLSIIKVPQRCFFKCLGRAFNRVLRTLVGSKRKCPLLVVSFFIQCLQMRSTVRIGTCFFVPSRSTTKNLYPWILPNLCRCEMTHWRCGAGPGPSWRCCGAEPGLAGYLISSANCGKTNLLRFKDLDQCDGSWLLDQVKFSAKIPNCCWWGAFVPSSTNHLSSSHLLSNSNQFLLAAEPTISEFTASLTSKNQSIGFRADTRLNKEEGWGQS